MVSIICILAQFPNELYKYKTAKEVSELGLHTCYIREYKKKKH